MHARERVNAAQGDRNHTVLVVDSDTVQLESISRGLLLHGHKCIRFTNIREAELFLSSPLGSEVDVLLTDLTEPDEARSRLIRHAHNDHPDLPIIVLGGWHTSTQMEAAKDRGISILQRPFNSERLSELIESVISE